MITAVASDGREANYVEVPFNPDRGPALGTTSFTLEMFVKPNDDPRRTVLAAVKLRETGEAGEAAVGARWLTRWKQTYFRDTRRGVTERIGNDLLKWVGSRARMDLYVSDGR